MPITLDTTNGEHAPPFWLGPLKANDQHASTVCLPSWCGKELYHCQPTAPSYPKNAQSEMLEVPCRTFTP
jgi:hypothetical protein